MAKKLLIIYTGGTIGMVHDKQSGALVPYSFDNIYRMMPVLENFDYRLEAISFNPLIDSSNVTLPFWIKLAETIEENYDKYYGFVILHGTDTMAYSASVLSFMLENLSKPVIFTGSQLPMGVVRTDGRDNFINSVEIAAAGTAEKVLIPEVAIFFENKLMRGNRTHKFNAENFDAFLSGNHELLATVGVNIRYSQSSILPFPEAPLKVHKKLNDNVAILKLFPGISISTVEHFLNTPGLEAVILETYGAGNAPSDDRFIRTLEQVIKNGLIVYNVTQCKEGVVEMGLYETSSRLAQIGVVGGSDITTESAIAKLMFLLGCGKPKDEIRRLLQVSLRGEMTD
jgi:L-asparaginase